MTITGHTPGPWSVEEPMDHELTIVEANRPTHEGRFIASCSFADPDEVHPLSKREVRANARLIAAAPELLEALDGLARAVTQRPRSGRDHVPAMRAEQAAMKKAFAALAKATAS